MTSLWLPLDFQHPLRVDITDDVHIRPISPDDLDIDMPAVMGNQAMLWDKYGDTWGWPPATMTAEEDREDLQLHAEDMAENHSFNYAILPSDESRLFGCIYIDPAELEPGSSVEQPAADVSWWVVPDAPEGLAAAVRAFVPAWLENSWPFATVRYPFGELN
ncbi:GNAT family N-acetyltransferase [Demequina aestuarii]|uniref:GNAT family N-acetyltransferase n=1 Tax=Demequina aestuarii TaxID=327095 RepID=UPI000781C0FC|nr:GNAT family N-acetyltransferase [Demequina aestuarii]